MVGAGQILLVEDPCDAARLYPLLLQFRTYQVTIARTFSTARTLCSATGFDLLICDLWLPDGDGYSLVKAARESSPEIRAILLTRNAASWSAEAALASGFSAWLARPVMQDRLRCVIERVLSGPEESSLCFGG